MSTHSQPPGTDRKADYFTRLERKTRELMDFVLAGKETSENTRAHLLHELEVIRSEAESLIPEPETVERKSPEVEPSAHTAILKAALSGSSDAVLISDAEGNIISFNEACVACYGFRTREEAAAAFASYHELFQYYYPDGRPAPADEWALPKALRGETGSSVEYITRRRDTDISWTASCSFSPIHDDSGAIIGAIVVSRDISEKKRKENELREAEKRYRQLADSMPQLVWTALPDGTVDYFNSKVKDYSGFERQPDGSWKWNAVLHPEDRAATEASFALALSTGKMYQAEHRVLMADGKYRWHLSRAVPELDENGKIAKWYGTATDIHEQKALEEDLQREKMASELRVREIEAVIDSIPESLMIFAPDGTAVRRNPAAEKLMEDSYDPEERNLPVEERLRCWTMFDETGKAIPADFHPVMRAIRGEEFSLVPVHMIKKTNGYSKWYSYSGSSVRSPDGALLAGVLISFDTTREKDLEETLRATKENAELANRAKTEFLAHMSHELRTPLGGIIGIADLLLPKFSRTEYERYISLIRDSARSLLAIIGNVLDISQIESGKTEIREKEFSLRDLVASCIEQFRIEAGQQGLILAGSVEENLADRCNADSDKISQVLRNLVSNAIKYTEHGSVSILVKKLRETGHGIELLFSVRDTGAGIPRDKQDYIFGEFTRIVHRTGKLTPGTGLGLAISKRLVELLGGELCLASEEGKGSTFSFSIPVKYPATPVDYRSGESLHGEETERPLRILLAEDTLVNRLFLETVLREAGHSVTSVGNGLEAVTAVEREPFDVVLMDIQMPVMDGLEATDRIRSLTCAWCRPPIVALTAYAMRGDRERMLEAGMAEYVTKPVDIDLLRKVMNRVTRDRE